LPASPILAPPAEHLPGSIQAQAKADGAFEGFSFAPGKLAEMGGDPAADL